MIPISCPDPEQLRAYVLGKLPEESSDTIASHLDRCLVCENTLATMDQSSDTLVSQLREPVVQSKYDEEPQYQRALQRVMELVGQESPLEDGGPVLATQPQVDRTTSGNAATSDLIPPSLTAGGEIRTDKNSLGSLGEYELLAKLGEGGMGAVYKARQTRLDKIVAIKVLPKERTGNAQAQARFEREMKAVGRVSHPNIVHALDARDIDGTTVLVMEYAEGLDLGEVVRRLDRLAVADACEIVQQAAMGLEAVHENGLVHRDIKPSNMMLTLLPSRSGKGAKGDGVVKILDLGLARLGTEYPSSGELTSEGQAMGTADYMAPEQVLDSHTVDIRADIYSLGCTLYKLLAGQAPFSGPEYGNPMKKMMAHVQVPVPSLEQVRSDVPKGLLKVLDRMLAKSPGDRFTTPAEVAEAIAPFAKGSNLPQLLKRAEQSSGARDKGDGALLGTEPQASSGVVGTDPSGMKKVSLSRTTRWERGRAKWAAVLPQALRRKPAAIGAIALGLSAVLLFGALLTLSNRSGTLVIESDDPNVQIVVKQGGEVVEVVDAKSGWKISLKSGQYELAMQGSTDQVRLDQDSVTVRRGDVVKVRLTFKPIPPLVIAKMPDTKPQPPAKPEPAKPQPPTVVVKPPEPTPQPIVPSAQRERLAAQWVLAEGGSVHVLCDGKRFGVNFQNLPKGDFQITYIGLGRSRLMNPICLKLLQGLSAIENLCIESQDFTDASLKYLNGLDALTSLDLHNSPISGVGFRDLKPLLKLKSLTLDGCPLQGSLADLARFAPNLEYLNLTNTQVSDGEGLKDLAASLRHLRMYNTQLTGDGANNLRHLKCLENLELSGPRMTDEGLRGIVESMLKLRSLVIVQSPITGTGLENLDRLENLESLDLHDTPVDFKWVRKPGKLIELRSLNLNCTRISDSGLAQVGKMLSLRNLHLYNTQVGDAGVERLTRLQTLSFLNLDRTRVTDAGLKHLASLESLGELHLDNTLVTDAGVKHLTGLKMLNRLFLDDTRITDAGVKHLMGLPTLNALVLRNTRVTDAGLEQLAECRSLGTLWVDNTFVSAEGVEAFRKRRPAVGIGQNAAPRKPDTTTPAVAKPDTIEIATETPEAIAISALSGWALVGQPATVAGLRSWTVETRGHRGGVFDVAFSPDSRWIASAGDDGTVRIMAWDPTESGPERLRQVRVLMAHTGRVRSLSWSPGGRYLASAGDDGTIRLWEPGAGHLLRTIRPGNAQVICVAWSPRGKTLAYAGDYGRSLGLCDLQAETSAQRVLEIDGQSAWQLAWSPDGRRLAVHGFDRTVRVWDADTGARKLELKGPNNPLRVAWSPDGKLAAWLENGSAILWNPDSGATLKTFAQVDKCRTFFPDLVNVTPDGKWWMNRPWLGQSDTRVIVNAAPGGGFHSVLELAYVQNTNGDTKVPGSASFAIRARFQAANGNWGSALTVFGGGVSSRGVGRQLPDNLTLSPDGKLLAVIDRNTMEILTSDLSKSLDRLAIGDRYLVQWSPDGQKIALGRRGTQSALMYDFATRKTIPLAENCTRDDGFRMAWSPDSKLAACANYDPTVWVCDAQTGALRQVIRGRSGGRGLAWSHDGKLLAVTSQENQERFVEVWEATDGGAQRQRWPLKFDSKSLVFSPDDRRLACGADQNCRVWDMASGRRLLDLATPAEMVAFSTDGHLLITCGNDNIMRRWYLEKKGTGGESASDEAPLPVSSVRPHPISARQADWSADGNRVAYSTDGYTTHLWNAVEGKSMGTVLTFGNNLVCITPGGHWRVFLPQIPNPTEFREDKDIVYVALTEKGEQITFTPEEFQKKYGWKNDPGKILYKAEGGK